MVLNGKGGEDTDNGQAWMTSPHEEDRKKALKDNSGYTTAELTELGITGSQGGGEHDPDTWEYKSSPYPMDKSVRSTQKFDLRDLPNIA